MPRCPIAFCNGTHPVKSDKSGSPFMFCDRARSNIWFRSQDAKAWLNQNGAGRGAIPTMENPVRTIETVGPAGPNEGEWDDADPNSATSRARVPLRCEECGTPILVQGLEACSGCGEPIVWEE